MTEIASSQDKAQVALPHPDLRTLDRLVGTWKITGDAEGTVTYQWIQDGFFLMQQVDMTLFGHRVNALEIIGHVQPFGEAPSDDIRSRAYDSVGNTLDYVYETNADTLIIWGGAKGSPSYFKGTFTDADTNTGAWVYSGGGYETTMARVS